MTARLLEVNGCSWRGIKVVRHNKSRTSRAALLVGYHVNRAVTCVQSKSAPTNCCASSCSSQLRNASIPSSPLRRSRPPILYPFCHQSRRLSRYRHGLSIDRPARLSVVMPPGGKQCKNAGTAQCRQPWELSTPYCRNSTCFFGLSCICFSAFAQ